MPEPRNVQQLKEAALAARDSARYSEQGVIPSRPKKTSLYRKFVEGIQGRRGNFFWGWFLGIATLSYIVSGVITAANGISLDGDHAVYNSLMTFFFWPLGLTAATMFIGAQVFYTKEHAKAMKKFKGHAFPESIASMQTRPHAGTVPSDASTSFAIHLSFAPGYAAGKQQETVELREYQIKDETDYYHKQRTAVYARTLVSETLPEDISDAAHRVKLYSGLAEDLERETWEKQHGLQVDAALRKEILLEARQQRAEDDILRQETLKSALQFGEASTLN